MLRNNFLLFCCLIVVISCKQNNNNNNISEFSVKFQTNEKIFLSDMMENFKLVTLETTESSILGEIKKTNTHNDHIYILSNNEIFVFKENGNFKQKINNMGRGPGEYKSISDFDIFSKSLYILDRTNQKILKYDLEGKHQKTINIKMWAQKLIVLNDDKIVIYSGEEDNAYNQCKFSIISNKGDIKGITPIDKRKSRFLHVNTNQNFVRTNSRIYFHEAFNDTIYLVNDTGITPKYRFNFKGSNIPDSFFDKKYNNIYNFFQEFNETNFTNGIYDLFFVKNNIFFKVYKNQDAYIVSIKTSDKTTKTSNQVIDNIFFENIEKSAEEINLNFSNDKLLYYIYPFELIKNKNHITNPELKKLISTISEENNPLIAISNI